MTSSDAAKADPAARPHTLVDGSLGPESDDVPGKGRRIGRFRVVGELGRGGMGTVLHAYDETLDRQLAVKLVRDRTGAGEDKRMLREAQALARLSHPNVVQVYEVGKVDGRMFIAMELVHGETLAKWHEKAQPWRECVDVYLKAGRGLTEAHAAGLVHRDFKPSNVIIDTEGRVVVLDFGLARDTGTADEAEAEAEEGAPRSATRRRGRRSSSSVAVHRSSGSRNHGLPPALASLVGSTSSVLEEDLTRTGALLGTLAYMAPEQVRGRAADELSDQFSFCASLYQGLFGERPYVQGGFSAMTMALDGRRPEPPPGIRVPRWLMAALWRGMQVEPDQRWPSLEELLDHIERRRHPRWPIWAPIGLGVLGAGVLTVGLLSTEPSPCEKVPDELDGIWDDAQRQALERKFRETGLEFAERTWEVVHPRIDTYAERWVEMRIEACEGQLRETHNPTPWARRVDCLDYDRVALEEAVGVLMDADLEVVSLANQVVGVLPPLEHCEDDEALRSEPRPERSEEAWAVEETREAMARVRVLREAGKYEDGLAEHVPILERARRLDYGPLLAEALVLRGRLQLDAGRFGVAEADLTEAYTLALRHGAHDVAAYAAAELVILMGYRQAQAESMQWLGPTAISIATWRDPDGPLLAKALGAQGLVLASQGRLDAALEHHERARVIIEGLSGPDSLELVDPLSNLAMVHKSAGEHAKAEAYDRQATQIIEDVLGVHHPLLARHLTNLGAVRAEAGELDDALALHERALAIYREMGLMQHPQVAHIRANLGLTLTQQDRHEDALVHCQAAIAIWEEALHGGAEHPWVSQALNCIGMAHRRQAQWGKAQRPLQRAVEILRRRRADHPELVVPLVNLGTVLEELGDPDEAERHYHEAIDVATRNPGQHDGVMVTALNKLGSLAYRAGGRDNEAVALHQRALGLLDAASRPDPKRRGITQWALGRSLARTGQPQLAQDALTSSLASYGELGEDFTTDSALVWTAQKALADLLWEQPSQRTDARRRMEAVRDRYETAGRSARVLRAQEWLDEHPAGR